VASDPDDRQHVPENPRISGGVSTLIKEGGHR
jgi:hypothetical protein